MAKEILLYSAIYDYTAADFIKQMNEAGRENVTIRMNTRGGSPEDSYGIIAKMKEHKGDVSLKVDGMAYSTGFFMLAYAKDVTALDVSKFMLHRAAYPSWIENDKELFTEARKDSLNRINADARKAIEAKLDVQKFESITGKSLDDIFSLDKREEVYLNAKQAKEIGLINEIIDITPEINAEVNGLIAYASGLTDEFPKAKTEIFNNDKTTKMTLEELKNSNPELVSKIEANAVKAEKERVSAWLKFKDIDSDAVEKGIQDGAELTTSAMAEFMRKSVSAQALANLAKSSAAATTTTEEVVNPEAKEVASFMDEVKKHLKTNFNQ